MKTKNIITIALITALSSAASIADSATKKHPRGKANPATIVGQMISNHDQDRDGRLNSEELANSIEALQGKRQEAIQYNRDGLIQRGVLPESSLETGVITLSLLPEDSAAIIMKRADANGNQTLDSDELMSSVKMMRSLNISQGPRLGRQS